MCQGWNTLFAARKWHARLRAYSNTLTHARTNRTHLPHATGAGGIILDFNRLLHAISWLRRESVSAFNTTNLGHKTHPIEYWQIRNQRLAHFRHGTRCRTSCDPGCDLPQHKISIFFIYLPLIEDGTHDVCNAGKGAGQCTIHTAWSAPARAASHPSAAIPAKQRSQLPTNRPTRGRPQHS